MSIRCVVLDFDGTFTDLAVESLPYTSAFRAALRDLVGRDVRAEWEAVTARIESSPADYGWTFDGYVVAPATADPYLLGNAVMQEILDGAALLRDPAVRTAVTQALYGYAYEKTLTCFRPEAREALIARFRAHDIERSYVALTELTPPAQITYETLYNRHPTDRVRFSSKVREGKRACTHVTLLESYAGGAASYVRCRLETGRTHQIRVHLSEAGFPLLGDAVYGRRAREPRVRAIAEALGRQALHAEVLGFEHPTTGRALRFESAPPEDFARALAGLRALR